MRILLTCNAGMSTSLLAEMMCQESIRQRQHHVIWCIDIEKVEEEANHCDILLLGPQVKHTFKRLNRMFSDKMPVAMIPSQEYGRLDGAAVLAYALQEIQMYHDQKEKG